MQWMQLSPKVASLAKVRARQRALEKPVQKQKEAGCHLRKDQHETKGMRVLRAQAQLHSVHVFG